jgi:hypothetical protein
MAFSTTAKNSMLGAITPDQMQLHSGDPGAAGTSNAVGSKTACSFAAASSGSRALSAQVNFTGLGASQAVSYFSVWGSSGTVFLGSGTLTGDSAANASGEYSVTTSTTLSLS